MSQNNSERNSETYPRELGGLAFDNNNQEENMTVNSDKGRVVFTLESPTEACKPYKEPPSVAPKPKLNLGSQPTDCVFRYPDTSSDQNRASESRGSNEHRKSSDLKSEQRSPSSSQRSQENRSSDYRKSTGENSCSEIRKSFEIDKSYEVRKSEIKGLPARVSASSAGSSSGMSSSGMESGGIRSSGSSGSLRNSASSGISLDDSERNASNGSLRSLLSSGSTDDVRRGGKTDVPSDDSKRSSCSSNSSSDDVRGTKDSVRKIESSLMIHVKRRAKPEFMGFVDAVTLAPAKAPHNRGVRLSANLLLRSPVSESDESPHADLRHHLDKLQDRKEGAKSLQLLLTNTLPQLDYQRELWAIADCLTASNSTVQRDAASRLERLLVNAKYSQMTNATHQLLAVAQKTRDIIASQYALDDHHLCIVGHIHLLAVAALICHSERPPTAGEWKTIIAWPKYSKKQSGDVVKQNLLKLMHVFYDQFERHLKDIKASAGATLRGDRKRFSRASVAEQFVSVFSVLNEISEQAWSEHGQMLLGELRELHEAVPKEAKSKSGQEARAALDRLFVRGLMVLLNTTYAKVRQQVGDGTNDHPKLAAEILVEVIRKGEKTQADDLQRDVSNLLFHESPLVTGVVNNLLPDSGQVRMNFALDFIDNSLVVADFHVTPPTTGSSVSLSSSTGSFSSLASTTGSSASLHEAHSSDGNSSACAWYSFRGRFGQRQHAEGAVFVHVASCAAKAPHYDCLHGSHSKLVTLQPHERHMDTLRQLCGPENVLRLLAYQHTPFAFYATEEVKDRRLLEQLLNHRAAHRWLDTSTLCDIALDIQSALDYLASRHIASRDVTAYDMTVLGRSRRGGTSGEVIEVLASGEFTIQLANFGLAHQYHNPDSKSGELRTVTEQGPIPVLWTPREGFVKGEYSDKSMVYSLGTVLYELWTHGVQPFTTPHKSTADTLRMMLTMPDSVMLIHWPCIPDDVYRLIQHCTSSDPERRPSLSNVQQELISVREQHSQRDGNGRIDAAGTFEQEYPAIMDDQVKRKYVPERGIPVEIQSLIDVYKKDEFQQYNPDSCANNRGSCADDPDSSHIVLATESELYTTEWIRYYILDGFTIVREKISARKFKENCLPLLEAIPSQTGSQLAGVTDWLKDPGNEPVIQKDSEDYVIHERRYLAMTSLIEMSVGGHLVMNEGDGYVSLCSDRYVAVFISIARALQELHERGWLHRDVRATNILVHRETSQITFMRIGRMCQVTPAFEAAVEEVFEDTRRWLAPEVLLEGKYRRENDVFMMGTAFWEAFRAREITARDPAAREACFLPFADHEKADVVRLVRSGACLPQPKGCPDWLYEVILKCRFPEPSERPTVREIIDVLLKHAPTRSALTPDRISMGSISSIGSLTNSELPSPEYSRTTPIQLTRGQSDPFYPPELPKRHNPVKIYLSEGTRRVVDKSGSLPRELTYASPDQNVLHRSSGDVRDGPTYLTPAIEPKMVPPGERVRRKTLPSFSPTKGDEPVELTGARFAGVDIRVNQDPGNTKTKVYTRSRSEGPSVLGVAPHLHPERRERTHSDPMGCVHEHEDEEHVYDEIAIVESFKLTSRPRERLMSMPASYERPRKHLATDAVSRTS